MGAVRGAVQPFPYQGSKRLLAGRIVACMPKGTARLIEPFAGSAAVSLAAAQLGLARRFLLNDGNTPLVRLWRKIVDEPDALAAAYESVWLAQAGRERAYYDWVRDRFNDTSEPHHFLYLLARCVKAAVRYNARGKFNNSPDNRRRGMRPDTMKRNLRSASALLRGRVNWTSRDYRDTLAAATVDDVVYMDPPYQGVCTRRDQRYRGGVPFEEFVEALAGLNRRGVAFMVSYDGRTGDKVHGQALPAALGLVRLDMEAGRSAQATLLGRSAATMESLYLSYVLLARQAAG